MKIKMFAFAAMVLSFIGFVAALVSFSNGAGGWALSSAINSLLVVMWAWIASDRAA